MKKRLVLCLFACLMVLLFAVPAMAADAPTVTQAAYEVNEQEITPFNERTRIYLRVTPAGLWQVRVWSITNGIWLTDWEYL